MELGLAIIVIGCLLILLAIYAWTYRSEFRRNRREAVFAFVVILPLKIIGGWVLYGFLVYLFTTISIVL
jgi:heme A synthase